jgi:ABC-type proline/glycine betaine transport system permease subunit
VKYRFKVPTIAEIKLWTLIVGYLSLFGSLIADLDNHFTQFITNVFAYSNEQHQSSFETSAQTRINYSGFKIAYVDSQFIGKVMDHGSYAKKSDTNYTQKESIQDWTSKFVDLLLDSISSVSRMFIALGLSFVAAIVVGITAARISLASRIVIPIVDVLQSIPILGFFPAAISLFIALFNGNAVGIEIAAIFLIFTSMAWNMIFSV